MTTDIFALPELGWSAAFSAQLAIEDLETAAPCRVSAVHRNGVALIGESGARRVETSGALKSDLLAVGDWVLVDRSEGHLVRLLERQTLLQRRAAGTGREVQLIAANVDALFIISSCNADFNVARLERYLALAGQAGILPVLVLTKADACEDPDIYGARAAAVSPALAVETLDAREPGEAARLLDWCGRGQTVAFLGSSGVGKSTLVNALTGGSQHTRGIREDDAKGRHTTTARSMHRLASGGWLIDTPGMRALRLNDVAEGVEAVFGDITEFAAGCRFADCTHESEPGCAVRAAIEAGDLESGRLARWRKLAREEAHNTASLAEQRRQSKALGRLHRSIQMESRDRKGT